MNFFNKLKIKKKKSKKVLSINKKKIK